jgi:hypothetical protein
MPQDKIGVIFLCRNSLDKEDVKQIAETLELEFGGSFLLDCPYRKLDPAGV